MIKNISGLSHVVVNGGNPSGPYVNTHSGQPMVGMVRYHNSNLEVYDGMTWIMIGGSYTTIDLTSAANAAINWAMNKMTEEARLKKLAEDHPAIQIALSNLEKAKQQLDATIILSKEHDTATN